MLVVEEKAPLDEINRSLRGLAPLCQSGVERAEPESRALQTEGNAFYRKHQQLSLDAHVLSRIPWGFFGSLTYKGKVPIRRYRLSMWFSFVYETAREWSVKPKDLVWVRREETGEQFGRMHQHFLIAASDSNDRNLGTCFQMMDRWEKLGGGFTRIRLYNSTLAGADYICKSLNGGDAYEMGKFNANTSALMLSHRLISLLKRKEQHSKQWHFGHYY